VAITDIRQYVHLTAADIEELGRELDAIRTDIEDPDAQFGQRTRRVTDTRRQPDSAIDPDARVGLHRMHALRPGPSTVLPQHPFTDGGPRVRGGGRSDNEPEVTCPQ
jgi:hypothetical protein